MFGCLGMTTRGVKFVTTGADGATAPWYFDLGLPSLTSTETGDLGAGALRALS